MGDLLHAWLAGLICGFVISVPVGPVNLTVINQALRRGFGTAFLAGAGAICAETIYSALMLAGHSWILDNPATVAALRAVALIVITAVGVRNLAIRPEKIEAGAETVQRVDERWHHPRSFLLGFLLTISNLMLLVVWATLAALLFAHDWVQPQGASRAVCVLGVFIGGLLWFFLLAFFVSRAHRRVKPRTLTLLVRASGVVFLMFAVLLAYRLFIPLARHAAR
jgi:L-lysine exporter family protein LysE/ArgO